MSIKALRWPCLALAVTAGTGCGYLFGDQGVFRDKSEDYKTAPELPVVRVPEGKSAEALGEAYPIPPVQENLVLAGEFEVPRPAPLVAGAAGEAVRIQKLGDQRWALIGVAPGQVWPQVRSFLASSNIQVARVDARAGIMDTNWIKLESQPMASRFRFRMEQGVQRGTSELHVLQMHQAGDADTWPARSDDTELEGRMLQAVAQYLANSADSAPVSMIAEQGIRSTGKVAMQESPDGYTYIRLELPYDRAWASLGRALTKSTFEITDQDRSGGIYYTRFLGQEEEEEGWLDWLWGSDDEQPFSGEPFVVSITREGEESVNIRLSPQDELQGFGKREEQAMLALIKGNIN